MPVDDRVRVSLRRAGHSCVLVSVDPPAGPPRRLLLDPGNLTAPLDAGLGQVDAVLVTHAHRDHVDPDHVRALRRAGAAPVYGDHEVQTLLADAGLDDTHPVRPGASTIADVPVQTWIGAHEVIYPGLPVPTNLSYLIAGRVFAPGDAFFVPDVPVDVLLLPVGGPWMKLRDTIDYLRTVSPRIAVPVHDGGLGAVHRNLHLDLIAKFAPDPTTLVVLDLFETFELPTVSTLTEGAS